MIDNKGDKMTADNDEQDFKIPLIYDMTSYIGLITIFVVLKNHQEYVGTPRD